MQLQHCCSCDPLLWAGLLQLDFIHSWYPEQIQKEVFPLTCKRSSPSLPRPSLILSSCLSGTAANLWTLISLSTTFENGSRHVGLGTHCGVLGCGCGSGQTSERACMHSHASAAAFLCRTLRPMILAICQGFLCILGFNQPIDHLCDWRPVVWILRPALRDELAQRLTDVARQRPSVPTCHLYITF